MSFLLKPRADQNLYTERQKRLLTKRASSQRRKMVSRSRSQALSPTTLWPMRNKYRGPKQTFVPRLILGEFCVHKSKMCEYAHLAFLFRHANEVLQRERA